MKVTPTLKPLGESALLVEFGNGISLDLNERAIALAENLTFNSFPGFRDAIPAYASTTIFFDPIEVRKAFIESDSATSAVNEIIQVRLSGRLPNSTRISKTIEIPVSFSGANGPDLETVALRSGLTVNDVIDIFTSKTYRVYMIGFLPGFAYMGDVDERIRVPRRPQPRVRVPKGSVAIAGVQTGVYPMETPGGWQLIGRTDVEFFAPNSDMPSLLGPGDHARFIAL